jgi:hypothetical protein
VFREAGLRVRQLVPNLLTIDSDDEVTLAAGDLVDFRAGVNGFDCSGQTGRRGQVVSNFAVFDLHVHAHSLGPP